MKTQSTPGASGFNFGLVRRSEQKKRNRTNFNSIENLFGKLCCAFSQFGQVRPARATNGGLVHIPVRCPFVILYSFDWVEYSSVVNANWLVCCISFLAILALLFFVFSSFPGIITFCAKSDVNATREQQG